MHALIGSMQAWLRQFEPQSMPATWHTSKHSELCSKAPPSDASNAWLSRSMQQQMLCNEHTCSMLQAGQRRCWTCLRRPACRISWHGVPGMDQLRHCAQRTFVSSTSRHGAGMQTCNHSAQQQLPTCALVPNHQGACAPSPAQRRLQSRCFPWTCYRVAQHCSFAISA